MKIKQKILAVFMTTILLGSNLLTLGNQVIASSSSELGGQDSKTNHANVEFNSYLEGDVHERVYNVDEEAKIYINLQVKENGYLKNGIVEFSNANYQINSNQINQEYIQKIEDNRIYLKQINYNQNIVIEIPISLLKQEMVTQDIFAKDSIVNFKGSYIDGNGNERTIEKTITNRIIWKADAELEVTGEISKYIPYHIGEEYGVFVQAKINTGIKENKLPIESTKIEVDVPEMNQIKPTRVNVIANTLQSTNGDENGLSFGTSNYTYDEENAKITIQTQNTVENGNINWKNGYDEYLINYIYTGEEIYNLVTQQLEQAKQTALTQEEKEEGKTNANAVLIAITVKVDIEAYNEETTTLQMEGRIQDSIEDTKGELVDSDINYTEEISKGYIYANYAKSEKEQNGEEIETKQQTEYQVTYGTHIYDIQTNGPIEYDIQSERFVVDGNPYSSQNNVIIKEVKIAENVFQKILGEEGSIQITKQDATTPIATINTETAKDENGNYIINLEEQNITQAIIQTSNPIIEGRLELTVTKAFKTDLSYTKTQMQTVTNVITSATVKTTATTKELTGEINLIEPVTKAQISIEEGKENLSTVIVNQDVSIRIVLDTSSVENALYQNPTFEIEMPEQVENIEIKDINLLLEDELKVKESTVQERNGKKVIRVVLEGTQTKYKDATTTNESGNVITSGANIIINTDITIDRLTPSKTETINLYYTNENTDLYENSTEENTNQNQVARMARANTLTTTTNTEVVGTTSTQVNLVAPTGVVPASGMSGYDDQGSEIMSVNGDKQEATIETYGPEKAVTIEGIVTNNYENSIENVFILGRLPFTGNKTINENNDLGSTFDMQMTSQITTSGIDNSRIKIYYSTNGDATRDLLQTGNNWTETPQDLSAVKSYLIVISGEVVASTQLSFNYQVNLPANLSYNNSAYTIYQVYYDNIRDDATIGETEETGIVGVTTGEGPELEIELTSNMEYGPVFVDGETKEYNYTYNHAYTRFFLNITNTSSVTAENVTYTVNKLDFMQLVTYDEIMYEYTEIENKITIGNIGPGETITAQFMTTADAESVDTLISWQISCNISADNMEKEITSNTLDFTIKPSFIDISNKTNTTETKIYAEKATIKYEITILPTSERNNVILTIPLPNDATVEQAYWQNGEEQTEEGVTINENNITAVMETMNTEGGIFIAQFTIGKETEERFSTKVSVRADGVDEHFSNEQYVYVGKPTLEGEQLKISKDYIPEGESFQYQFTLQSTGATQYNVIFEDQLPEGVDLLNIETQIECPPGLDYQNTERPYYDKTNRLVRVVIPLLPADSTVTITLNVTAMLNSEEEDGKEIINTATIMSNQVEQKTLNSVTNYIEYVAQEHENPNTGQGGNSNYQNGRYRITGKAWIDANQNGQRDETEALLGNMQVMLLYQDSYAVVKDPVTNMNKITTTNPNGEYTFDNISPDEYLVIFLYDTGRYSITEYQAQNVNESYNSDAISMRVILDGEQRYVGVTDTIRISNGNARDIDIGLYEAAQFDLRLDKYISKITLTTPTIGTVAYEYENSQLEKIEVLSQNINNSSIVVEYKIVVTNEGQVSGYARKIVDYLPEDAGFNTEINSDWYLSDNQQNVYNASLANEIIQPGESKEVTLVLSFNITDKNIGQIINNNAEIAESYNEQGITDMDSTDGNNIESEDDMSNADIVLGVVTGTIILYTALVLAIIALLVIAIYIIKQKVLKK